MNPSQMMKAIKNDVEIENSKNAHIKDGVAMTKFMYWLKKNYGKIPMDEMSISHQVLQFRQQQDLFIEPSFTTICAWKDNAALMHYHPTENQYTTLDQDGMLLIDSGGQYMDGTTDITRTFVLGHITDMQKKHFYNGFTRNVNFTKCSFLIWMYRTKFRYFSKKPYVE